MPRKSNATLRGEPEASRNLDDLSEHGFWRRRRQERETREERRDQKRDREERQ